jgi:uncharacterized protein (TIGR00251 family)
VDVTDLYRIEGEGAAPIESQAKGETAGDAEGEAPGDAEAQATVTVSLGVHVQPGAGRSAVVGRHGDALKVRVAAAPEGGRANEATSALLAETFGVKPSAVELVGGATSRSKRFRLSGVDAGEFRRQLERVVAAGGAAGGPASGPAGRR